ncbi:MAG: hypothetical protein LUG98_00190 [Tannerellaceae bacterium]|nr:hypothetical protein [Tannerellaceae bacterium]
MKKYISIVSSILCLLFSSCRNEDLYVTTGPAEIAVYISTQVPLPASSTRAVEEELVSSVNVLVFEGVNGADYEFAYQVAGYSLTTTNTGYDFYARITPASNSLKLYLVANAPTNGLTAGDPEETVRETLTGTFTAAGFDGPLPMFGEIEFTDGLEQDDEISTALVRSVARADVYNTTTNFTLTSVQLFRASNQYQIIPDQLVDDRVTSPSIPAGTTQSVNTIQQEVTATNSVGQLYLPEAPAVGPEGDQQLGVTAVVIGGLFETDTEPTYYRLDFVPDGSTDLFGQVLRNHRYQFNIKTVLASGWRTPEEAAEYYSSQIEVEVKVWEEDTVTMVFDDVNYFGVSERRLVLPYAEGAQRVISVDTNLETYELYWTDEAGTIDDSVLPIKLGESFTSPDGNFTVAISADGTRIIVTANRVNDTGTQITDYLLAGVNRMRIPITLIQDIFRIQNSSLNVFGCASEIGNLGDYVLGTNTSPGERAEGMVAIMRNTANFGPSGIVPMQGINIAGRVAATGIYTEALINMFDVLYLTYARNPQGTELTNILNWHAASDRRVLFIQFDNTVTTGPADLANSNNRILNALGVLPYITRRYADEPYTLYEDAPAVITNGIFGPVSPTLQYRRVDDTYSTIDLDFALENGITPVLMARGGVLLGIDFDNRIIYSGDIDLYNSRGSSQYEFLNTTTGAIEGSNINAKRLIANLWAWIINVALAE